MKINECRATMNTSYEIDKTLLLYRAKSAKKKPTMHLYRYISYGLYKSLEYRESLHLQSTLSFRNQIIRPTFWVVQDVSIHPI